MPSRMRSQQAHEVDHAVQSATSSSQPGSPSSSPRHRHHERCEACRNAVLMSESAHVRPSSARALAPAAPGTVAVAAGKGSSSPRASASPRSRNTDSRLTNMTSDHPESSLRQLQIKHKSGEAVQPGNMDAALQATDIHLASPQLPFAAATPVELDVTAANGVPAAAVPSVSLHPLPSTLLPAVGTSDAVSSDVLAVLGAWYAMYRPDKEAQLQAALAVGYDSKASFEDNFLQVTGHDQLSTLFYTLQRCTDHIEIHIEKLEVLVGDAVDGAAAAGAGGGFLASQATMSSGVYQLRITGRHAFFLPKNVRGPVASLFLPPALVAWATDVLSVRQSDNKIIHWQQRVHNIPVAPGLLRWSVGLAGSMLLQYALGW